MSVINSMLGLLSKQSCLLPICWMSGTAQHIKISDWSSTVMCSQFIHNWLWLWFKPLHEHMNQIMHVHMRLWRHLNVCIAHSVCPSSYQCFCIFSGVYCLELCVHMGLMFSVLSCTACLKNHVYKYLINSPCVFCVCIGGYCRSICSCCISSKEHEPPGNAQKHQHWWHQHKSAKFTLLQIVVVRPRACRCQSMFTVMHFVYQNLKLLKDIPSQRYCVIWHFLNCCYLCFPIKKVFWGFFSSFFFLERTKYLFIISIFLLPHWVLDLDV